MPMINRPWVLPSNPPYSIIMWPNSAYFAFTNHDPTYCFKKAILDFTAPFTIDNLVGWNREILSQYNTSVVNNGTREIKIIFPDLCFKIDDGLIVFFTPDLVNKPLISGLTLKNEEEKWSYSFKPDEINDLNDKYISPLYS
jgi:hypothetical protein